MEFEFGPYRVDVNVEKTREFYKNANLISEECSCDRCLNFEEAASHLSTAIISFFEKLGIDIRKACEVYVFGSKDDSTLLYGGIYHICGIILSGESAWVLAGIHGSQWAEELAFSITEDFHISLDKSNVMLEEGFPLPAFQLDILANIPWVLMKENTYIG